MFNEEIKQFIIDSRAKNVSDTDIKDTLGKAGWALGDVMKTFDVLGTNGISVPSPHVTGHFGMWLSFLYILMFISLYILATSVGVILHTGVEEVIPDAIDKIDQYDYLYYYYSYSDWYVNYAKASIIVSFPVFSFLVYLLGKKSVSQPLVRKLRARKLLIYISLVVTFIIMISSIIFTLFGYFNDGIVTSRIFAHIFITVLLSGGIFGVLLYLVKGDSKL